MARFGKLKITQLDDGPVMKACDVELNGMDISRFTRGVDLHMAVGEVMTATLDLYLGELDLDIGNPTALADRNRDWGLAGAPEDVKHLLTALYQLDGNLPEGKEAVVDVHDPDESGNRFTVRIIESKELG